MDLRNRSSAHRYGINRSEKRLNRGPSPASIAARMRGNGTGGRESASEAGRVRPPLLPGPGGLPETDPLYGGRADPFKGPSIGWRIWWEASQPRKACQTTERRRRIRVLFDAQQGAVPRKRPAPLQCSPNMCRATGRILPAAVNGYQPAQHGLNIGMNEAGPINHPLERCHVGKRRIDFIR